MKILWVKQYTNAEFNDEQRFIVAGRDGYGDKVYRSYGLYDLPKYAKRFMATHECEPFDTEETDPVYGVRSFIYGRKVTK